MRLSELKTGEEAVIVKIYGHGAFRRRVMEMGFVRGKNIKVLLNAPLHDPIKYRILDYEVSLRRSEAALIEVVVDDEEKIYETSHLNTVPDDATPCLVEKREKTISVALIGNPNSGKTSIFNRVCGAHEHVGNYGGVTVDAKKGNLDYKGYHFEFIDLPGTYSLSAYSPEEMFVRRYLKDEISDVILNVIDSSNLERNLYLTTELIDMDRSMIIALNMYDELEKKGIKLDEKQLGKMIGVPIVPTVSKTGAGTKELLDGIIKVYEHTHEEVRHVHVSLGTEIENAISDLREAIRNGSAVFPQFSTRYLAIKFLEKDSEVESMLYANEDYNSLVNLRNKHLKSIDSICHEDISSIIASEKYGYIAGALKETRIEPEKKENDKTRIIDKIVTNKILGFPIFLLLMWLMFWCTFELGAYPQDWINIGIGYISEILNGVMSPGPLKDLLIDGVIGGVGGVIIFLPNILIMYFFISFMEDSGYMARAAFIMDKIMHKIGLHGKSFIPMVMGFGCSVPAIMATRTIESKSSRLITILINPFMSCSARLPIYVLLVGAFFPEHPSLMFMMLYALGILVAVLTALLLRKLYFKKDETPFVMELPPYRIPTSTAVLRHMWTRSEQYLKKMGGVILVASLIVWALSYFPRDWEMDNSKMTAEQELVQQQNSYLAKIGKVFTPVVEPLGMDWKTSIAIISGVSAKEIVVSTLGVLYPATEGNNVDLGDRLKQINPEPNKPNMTPLQALAFMIFVLLYFPCIASMVAIVKETGSWKYGAFAFVYNTGAAWLVSFIVYQVGLLII